MKKFQPRIQNILQIKSIDQKNIIYKTIYDYSGFGYK